MVGRVCPVRETRKAPGEDDQAQNQPGKPGIEGDCGAVIEALRGLAGDVFAGGVEDAFWLPEAEEDDEGDDGGGRSDDVDQPGAAIGGHEVLGKREGAAGDENGRPDLDHGAEAGIDPDEPEGNDEAEGNEDDGGDSGEEEEVDSGDGVQGDDGNSERAEGDGSGVGEQGKPGGLDGTEAEADEDGSADGDGGAEARRRPQRMRRGQRR